MALQGEASNIGKISSVVSTSWKEMPSNEKKDWNDGQVATELLKKAFKKEKHLRYNKK